MHFQQLESVSSLTIDKPTWEIIDAALHSLDGKGEDGIILKCNGRSYMGISGGEKGKYAIVGFLEGFGEFICANGAEGPPKDVVVAGDYNSFASKNVVEFQCVLVAAKYFFEGGALSEDLKWEKTL